MTLYHFRRIGFLTIVGASLVSIVGVWTKCISLYNSRGYPDSHLDTLLATIIQNTGAVGGIAVALLFLTAQLSASKPSVLRELYRSIEIYILLFYFVVTLLLGYGTLAMLPSSIGDMRFVDTALILASTFVLLVVPVLILQIENLDLTTLSSKLADRISPRAIVDYGLTSVQFDPGDPTRIKYRLITVGLRPRGVDPFRAVHEVLMEAVTARDRVLFGKLFRHFLKQIAVVYGARWDLSSRNPFSYNSPNFLLRTFARRYSLEERIHLSLAILHYAVKRARNLKTEWDGRDIGRHGILTGIGDLIFCLSVIPQADITIRIAIYAALHIGEYYSSIHPFGRIEPFNAYFKTSMRLEEAGKIREAELCVAMLAWISVHTEQLRHDRSPELHNELPEKLRLIFLSSQGQAQKNAAWMPGLENDDPWRRWLD